MDNREKFSAEFEKFIENYMAQPPSIKRVRINVVNTLITLVIASLGLISALAWDEYLKTLFDEMFNNSGTLGGLFAYAVVATVVTVIVTIVLGKRTKE